MGYTNTRATMKWWDTHTKKLKYYSSIKFDEYNKKFGYNILNEKYTSDLPTIQVYISDQPLIKE